MSFLRNVSCLVVFAFSVSAWAENWPQYRGVAGDGKSNDSIGKVDFANGPNLLWKVPTPLGFSSFSIADGQAYTVIARDKQEMLVALNADTGAEKWAVALGSSEYEQGGGNAGAKDNKGGDGPRSTPSTDGKFVFVYDSYMVLSCFDSQGKRVWQQDIVKDYEGRNIKWLNATSPLLVGDSVIVGGGGAGQSFLAFNKNTGDLLWKSGDETITHATPHVTTFDKQQQVVFFVQSGLISVDPQTGKQLWRTKFPFSVSTAASPVSEGNLIYCSAGYGVGAGLFEVNGNSEPSEVWFKSNELMNHWSTPVAHNGYLYGIFEFKKYGKAPLQCVDMRTGEIKWSERGFGPGNCILVGDKLVVLSDAGELSIVAAQPNAYQEIARSDVLEGKCWSTPSYSDGRIYIRSTVEAACVSVK
ncbi:MAG: PQQ-binding-like beta-propeller repeat protein [Rubripirellula sp.]